MHWPPLFCEELDELTRPAVVEDVDVVDEDEVATGVVPEAVGGEGCCCCCWRVRELPTVACTAECGMMRPLEVVPPAPVLFS